MRLGLLDGVFWGVFLIILGLCAIFKTVFHINVSLLRIGFALLIIYIGVSMLFNGSSWRTDRNTVLFDDRELVLAEQDEYNVIFGRGLFDLTALPAQNRTRRLTLNVVFGEGVIKIKREAPITSKVSSVLSGARLGDGNQITIGEYTYRSGEKTEHKEGVLVEVNVVFGSLVFSEE